ncbi:hypothetical protein [Falsiruegeria litorea]|nr:hypothetical protein [Falsiruegeria litorea]
MKPPPHLVFADFALDRRAVWHGQAHENQVKTLSLTYDEFATG